MCSHNKADINHSSLQRVMPNEEEKREFQKKHKLPSDILVVHECSCCGKRFKKIVGLHGSTEFE
ncbi:MAG: hypothetical protein WCW87_01110 [Candidatus Paceibacterota bacterium]